MRFQWAWLRREFVEHRDDESVKSKRESAGNRRGSQHQHVGRSLLAALSISLLRAAREAVAALNGTGKPLVPRNPLASSMSARLRPDHQSRFSRANSFASAAFSRVQAVTQKRPV